MGSYQIVDEPKVKSWGERIIVDPTIILFAAIFLPLIIDIPAGGRFWVPIVWLTINGIALGSATLQRELMVLWLGGFGLGISIFGVVFAMNQESVDSARIVPYLRTLLFAGFYLVIYLAVFYQQKSYELYDYIRGRSS